jgi:hypothetical protein
MRKMGMDLFIPVALLPMSRRGIVKRGCTIAKSSMRSSSRDLIFGENFDIIFM